MGRMKRGFVKCRASACRTVFALAIGTGGCATVQSLPARPTEVRGTAEPTVTVVRAADLQWEQLNPARGAASPMAANVWGDRASTGATGFVVRFVDGFESPPHIHNVSYRGVVLRGLVHNDDPNADRAWMPPGSFWTQPRGAVHITSAKGSEVVAYIEIEQGPYLVRPVDQAFISEEQSINVDRGNLVWVDARQAPAAEELSASAASVQIAYLWGSPGRDVPSGALVRLRPESKAVLVGDGKLARAMVIGGQLTHQVGALPGPSTPMGPGGHLRTDARRVQLSCKAGDDCLVYVRFEGRFSVEEAPG